MPTLRFQTVIMIVPFSNNVYNKSFTDMFYSVCSLSSSSCQGLPLDELQNYLGSAVIVFNLQKKALVFSSILDVSRVNTYIILLTNGETVCHTTNLLSTCILRTTSNSNNNNIAFYMRKIVRLILGLNNYRQTDYRLQRIITDRVLPL